MHNFILSGGMKFVHYETRALKGIYLCAMNVVLDKPSPTKPNPVYPAGGIKVATTATVLLLIM